MTHLSVQVWSVYSTPACRCHCPQLVQFSFAAGNFRMFPFHLCIDLKISKAFWLEILLQDRWRINTTVIALVLALKKLSRKSAKENLLLCVCFQQRETCIQNSPHNAEFWLCQFIQSTPAPCCWSGFAVAARGVNECWLYVDVKDKSIGFPGSWLSFILSLCRTKGLHLANRILFSEKRWVHASVLNTCSVVAQSDLWEKNSQGIVHSRWLFVEWELEGKRKTHFFFHFFCPCDYPHDCYQGNKCVQSSVFPPSCIF